MSKQVLSPYFVFSDSHCRHHSRRRYKAAYELMKEIGCKGVVMNGDTVDMEETSSHDSGSLLKKEGQRFVNTMNVTNEFLDETLEHSGTGEHYFVWGNHEDRIDRWLAKDDNGVFAGDPAFDLVERLSLKERGFKVYREYKGGIDKGGFFLGKLLITHGELCGENPWEGHMKKYQTSVIFGHSHTVGMKYYSTYTGQRASFNAGFMADENSSGLKYESKPNRHVPGFALVYLYPNGHFNVDLIRYQGFKFSYGGYVFNG